MKRTTSDPYNNAALADAYRRRFLAGTGAGALRDFLPTASVVLPRKQHIQSGISRWRS